MDYLTLKQQIVDDIKEDSSASSKALKQMIQEETANYQTVAEYSKVFGDSVSKSIVKNIAEGIPDEELGQFASECLAPIYRQSQDTMLNACKNVQKIYNKQAGLALNPVDVKRDESRIQHIVERFEEAEKFDEVKFLTNSNVARSITRGAVQDSMRSNAKFQSDVGLKVRISRSDGSGCCDWCASVVGTYDSFDKLPDNFWGIHRGCSCVIDYRVGNTRNKISFKTDEKGNLSKVTEEILEDGDYKKQLKDNLWESYLYHVENNQMVAVTSEERKEDYIKIDYGKLSDETQKVFSETISSLSNEYDTTLREIRLMDKMEFLSHKDSFAFVYHSYETDFSTLAINSAKCGDINKLAERIRELSDNHYSINVAQGKEREYVATHEFAHTLLDTQTKLNDKRNWLQSDYEKIRSARSEIESIYKEYIDAYTEIDKKAKAAELNAITTFNESDWKIAAELSKERDNILLGKYSLVSADEFMAEAFTASKIGSLDNEYGIRVVEVVDKYFKR